MQINGKNIKDISFDDLKQLIKNKIPESLTLEYKSKLPGNSDTNKREFLGDISSFANKDGGVIIYGIKEKKDQKEQNLGFPDKICGIEEKNIDKAKQRLESIIQTGLIPKLTTIQIESINCDDKIVLLIGIPKSTFSPHIIWFQKNGKFYIRTNSGKDQMDVHQIREAFLQSDSWEKQTDNYRRQRIMEVLNTDLIPDLNQIFPVFIHIVPLQSKKQYDINLFRKEYHPLIIAPYETTDFIQNIDGLLIRNKLINPNSYVQVFRNGGVEFYCNFEDIEVSCDRETVIALNGVDIEEKISKYLKGFLTFSERLNIDLPYIIYISLFNVKGKYLYANKSWLTQSLELNHTRFDRDQFMFPGFVIERSDTDVEKLIDPIFDLLWQSAGWVESGTKNLRNKSEKT